MPELIAQEVGTRVDDPPGSAPIRSQFVASQVVGLVVPTTSWNGVHP
jgi:hypothetical protein